MWLHFTTRTNSVIFASAELQQIGFPSTISAYAVGGDSDHEN